MPPITNVSPRTLLCTNGDVRTLPKWKVCLSHAGALALANTSAACVNMLDMGRQFANRARQLAVNAKRPRLVELPRVLEDAARHHVAARQCQGVAARHRVDARQCQCQGAAVHHRLVVDRLALTATQIAIGSNLQGTADNMGNVSARKLVVCAVTVAAETTMVVLAAVAVAAQQAALVALQPQSRAAHAH